MIVFRNCYFYCRFHVFYVVCVSGMEIWMLVPFPSGRWKVILPPMLFIRSFMLINPKPGRSDSVIPIPLSSIAIFNCWSSFLIVIRISVQEACFKALLTPSWMTRNNSVRTLAWMIGLEKSGENVWMRTFRMWYCSVESCTVCLKYASNRRT